MKIHRPDIFSAKVSLESFNMFYDSLYRARTENGGNLAKRVGLNYHGNQKWLNLRVSPKSISEDDIKQVIEIAYSTLRTKNGEWFERI